MKRINILPVFLFSFFSGWTQHVTNIRAFEEEGSVMILYDLFTVHSDREFLITLFASQDDGKTFTEISDAKGDVGRNVKAGSDHAINWKPGQGKNFVFKVKAGFPVNTIKATFDHASGKINLIAVERVVNSPNTVQFIFTLTNNRPKNSIFIPSNYSMVDDKGNAYHIATLNNRTSNFFEIAKGATDNFKIVVDDVPETITKFTKIEFALSEIPVKFSDVKIGL